MKTIRVTQEMVKRLLIYLQNTGINSYDDVETIDDLIESN